jgi:hypothetical protein
MEESVQVLVIPVNESPYLKTIPNTLEAMQGLVGGYIELIQTEEGFNVFCNEEGKLTGLEPNFYLTIERTDYLAGQIFVTLDDGEGDITSLSKAHADFFLYEYVVGRKVNPANNMLSWSLR